MKCSKCNKELNRNIKKAGIENTKLSHAADAFCLIAGGPIVTAIGAFNIGRKVMTNILEEEVEIKCPHCGAKMIITKEEYKKLKC